MIWWWVFAIALTVSLPLAPYLAGAINFRDGFWFLRRDI